MTKIINATIEDIIDEITGQENNILDSELLIIETNGAQAHKINANFPPLRIEAYSLILVCRGEIVLGIDYMTYTLKENNAIELFSYHLIEFIRISADFKAYHIIISSSLYNEIISQMGLSASLELHSGRFRSIKIIQVNEMHILMNQFERLRFSIQRNNHQFFKAMVRGELALLLLEFAEIKLSDHLVTENHTHTHREEIVSRFIQLLINHCKSEREVSFYSTKLCITPEYLSRIMKTFSGKSVNVWIQQARISEAKIMLRKPDSSIHEVADALCFSDQSAFGKFFKKHTGISPLEYQKKTIRKFSVAQIENG